MPKIVSRVVTRWHHAIRATGAHRCAITEEFRGTGEMRAVQACSLHIAGFAGGTTVLLWMEHWQETFAGVYTVPLDEKHLAGVAAKADTGGIVG